MSVARSTVVAAIASVSTVNASVPIDLTRIPVTKECEAGMRSWANALAGNNPLFADEAYSFVRSGDRSHLTAPFMERLMAIDSPRDDSKLQAVWWSGFWMQNPTKYDENLLQAGLDTVAGKGYCDQDTIRRNDFPQAFKDYATACLPEVKNPYFKVMSEMFTEQAVRRTIQKTQKAHIPVLLNTQLCADVPEPSDGSRKRCLENSFFWEEELPTVAKYIENDRTQTSVIEKLSFTFYSLKSECSKIESAFSQRVAELRHPEFASREKLECVSCAAYAPRGVTALADCIRDHTTQQARDVEIKNGNFLNFK